MDIRIIKIHAKIKDLMNILVTVLFIAIPVLLTAAMFSDDYGFWIKVLISDLMFIFLLFVLYLPYYKKKK